MNEKIFKNIDIWWQKIDDKKISDFKNNLINEVIFLDEKLKLKQIDIDTYNYKIEKIKDFLISFDWKEEDLKKEFNKELNNIKKDIWDLLSDRKEVVELQNKLYNELWIDKYTYRNNSNKRFIKWIIDASIVDNYEMIKNLWEDPVKFFKEIIENFSIEDIINWIFEDFKNVISWDAYEKWKSIISVLATTWWWLYLLKKWLQKWNNIELKWWIHKLTDDKIDKLTDRELLWIIINNENKNIDINWLSTKNKQKINNILTQNYPLYWVSRLTPNSNLININISWIKNINDKFWQDFTDLLNKNFKEEIFKNLEKTWYNSRVIRSDYKNISLVLPKNSDISKLFWHSIQTKDFIEKIINKTISESNLAHSEKTSAINLIRENYNFWVWKSKIWTDTSNIIHNIEYLRQAEITSRRNIWNSTDNIVTYSSEESLNKIRNSINIENEILSKYEWKSFSYKWKDFKITTNINNENKISSDLLRVVRKWEEINPKELKSEIEKYIKELNDSIDFISPLRTSIKFSQEQVNEAEKIWKMMKDGIIDKKYLSTTYKWWLNKDVFINKITNIPWESIFIDIKDMWIHNLVDYREKAKKIDILSNSYKKWEISKEKIELELYQTMLEAWLPITEKFIEFKSRLKTIYPNAKIHIWWDEIYIFNNDWKHIDLQQILNILNTSDISWRLTRNNWIGSERNFADLDLNSNINKKIEEYIKIKTNIDFKTTINLAVLKLEKEEIKKFLIEIESILKNANLENLLKENWEIIINTSKWNFRLKNKSNNILEINTI